MASQGSTYDQFIHNNVCNFFGSDIADAPPVTRGLVYELREIEPEGRYGCQVIPSSESRPLYWGPVMPARRTRSGLPTPPLSPPDNLGQVPNQNTVAAPQSLPILRMEWRPLKANEYKGGIIQRDEHGVRWHWALVTIQPQGALPSSSNSSPAPSNNSDNDSSHHADNKSSSSSGDDSPSSDQSTDDSCGSQSTLESFPDYIDEMEGCPQCEELNMPLPSPFERITSLFWNGGITTPEALSLVEKGRTLLVSIFGSSADRKGKRRECSGFSRADTFKPCAEDLMQAHVLVWPSTICQDTHRCVSRALLRLHDREEVLESGLQDFLKTARRDVYDHNNDGTKSTLNAACDVLMLMSDVGSYLAMAET